MPLSSLSGVLIAANSGMRAAQVGLDVVSRNVSNASTPGYTRKFVQLENRVVGGQGQGVLTGEIQRAIDKNLQREIRIASSSGEAIRAREEFLGRLELAFGAPGENSSIASQLGNLADSFRALISQPDSSTQRQTVLAKAEAFVRSANQLSVTVQAIRLDADKAIDAEVDAINTTLHHIDDLNAQIVQARGLGQSTADLEDKRDILLDRLSQKIDVNSYERPTGEVWILTKAGRQLLDGAVNELSFNSQSAINAAMTFAGGALGGIELGGVDITAEIRGGRLQGLFDVRDDLMTDAQSQLDELTARVAQNLALADLDLFGYGAIQTVVTGRSATATASAGATSFTVSSAAGLAVGMDFRFANHATTYEITGIAGTTITFAPSAGPGTSLSDDVPSGTGVIFAEPPGAPAIGFSAIVEVSATVIAEPWRLRDGTTVATQGTLATANAIPRAVVDAFQAVQPFTASAGLGSSQTLVGYAGALISTQSNLRASEKDSLAAQDALTEQLDNRFKSDAGVNVDRELALMLEIQNAYAASARVIQATSELFDELLRTAG